MDLPLVGACRLPMKRRTKKLSRGQLSRGQLSAVGAIIVDETRIVVEARRRTQPSSVVPRLSPGEPM